MRFLTRKIYRAFPELDQFDDKSCERYVYRAKRKQSSAIGFAVYVLTVIASLVVWIQLELVWIGFFKWIFGLMSYRPGPYMKTFIEMVFYLGVIWVPWITCLVMRDLRLHRSIRNQLRGAQCVNCGYILVGLEVRSPQYRAFVRCPECGEVTVLADSLLEIWEVDPSHPSS